MSYWDRLHQRVMSYRAQHDLELELWGDLQKEVIHQMARRAHMRIDYAPHSWIGDLQFRMEEAGEMFRASAGSALATRACIEVLARDLERLRILELTQERGDERIGGVLRKESGQ
jgi:hypothetical protein